RLLHALTDLDAQRAVSPPADTTDHARPRTARRRFALMAATPLLIVGPPAVPGASGVFPSAPAQVRRIFAGLGGDRDVDADRAGRIGGVGGHEGSAGPP